ncbi:MAG: hypothetical protein JST93_14795 [Acidobacteria bacterium]|nr:hypothetical protein [Acidobacteriota bacterium]
MFEVLEVFDGRDGLVAAVLGKIAVGAGEETLLAVEVLVEGFEVLGAEAIGQGLELVGGNSGVVFFDEFFFIFSDCEIYFGGMRGFEAANLPAGVNEALHEVGLELVLGLEEIVVESGEGLEDFLGFGFQDDSGRVHPMSRAVEGGTGLAFGGDAAPGLRAIDAGLLGSGEGHRVCSGLSVEDGRGGKWGLICCVRLGFCWECLGLGGVC